MRIPSHLTIPRFPALCPLLLVVASCGDGSTPLARRPPAECLADPLCTQPLVAAHRGYHVALPENSLAALRAAAELGADLVEVDVRHTAD